jgi:hypothetical protein
VNIAVASSSGLHAVSGASNGAPPQQKMSNLFDSIDTGGREALRKPNSTKRSRRKIRQPFSRIRERMRFSHHSTSR